jgi:chemotaxis protein CheD
MSSSAESSAVNLIPVRMGELVVSKSARDAFSVIGIGSCVAVILIAPERRAAALAHVVLPEARVTGGREAPPGKFADTAVDAMLKGLRPLRVKPEDTYAMLVGGATMFGHTHSSKLAGVGRRNVEAAKIELSKRGIGVASEEVGGTIGRSVHVSVAELAAYVRSGPGEPSRLAGSARPLRVKEIVVQPDLQQEPFPGGVFNSDTVKPNS